MYMATISSTVLDIKPGFESGKARLLPIIDKSQQRSLKVDTPETLPPLHFTRVGPIFPDGSSFSPPAENDSVYTAMMQDYYVWLFSRYIGSNGKQLVPGQGGFISATGSPPPRKSTVDYFTPIHQPITDNSVVRDARTSKSGNARRILRKDQHICHSALPTVRRHPRGSVIPQ